jgi:hypothetical protein
VAVNTRAVDLYIKWGADKEEALEAFGLPVVEFKEPEPQPIPPALMGDDEDPEEGEQESPKEDEPGDDE